MKKIVVAYFYLLMYQALAIDCQCKRHKIQVFTLIITPPRPVVGEDVCMCCSSLVNFIPTTFLRNGVTVCTVGNVESDGMCKRLGSSQTVFQIENITTRDSGSWRCNTSYDVTPVVDFIVDSPIAYSTSPAISSSVHKLKSRPTKTVIPTLSTESATNLYYLETENGQFNLIAICISVGIAVVIILIIISLILYRICKRKQRPYDKTDRRYSGRSRNDSNPPFSAEELLQLGTPRVDDDSPYYLSLNIDRGRRGGGATGVVGDSSSGVVEGGATVGLGGTISGGSHHGLEASISEGTTSGVEVAIGGTCSGRVGGAIGRRSSDAGIGVMTSGLKGKYDRREMSDGGVASFKVDGRNSIELETSCGVGRTKARGAGNVGGSISQVGDNPTSVNVVTGEMIGAYGRRDAVGGLGVMTERKCWTRGAGKAIGEGGRVTVPTEGAIVEGGATGWVPDQLSEVERNVMKILSSHLQTILRTAEINPCFSNYVIKKSIDNGGIGQETNNVANTPDVEASQKTVNERSPCSKKVDVKSSQQMIGEIGPDSKKTDDREPGSKYCENSKRGSCSKNENEDVGSTNKEADGGSNDGYQIIDDEDIKSRPSEPDTLASDDLADVSSTSCTGDLDNAYLHPTLENS